MKTIATIILAILRLIIGAADKTTQEDIDNYKNGKLAKDIRKGDGRKVAEAYKRRQQKKKKK